MKKKLLIALAVLITCGVVFAAAKTTFYTILDMTGHKITNVATPTANADAATKAYADTKLAKSGGAMTGEISMGGEKITSLASPTASNDAATKSYVDTTVAKSVKPGYQYFALRKGGKYDPLVSVNNAVTGDFWVVVLRPFSGSVTSYTDNVTLKAGKFFPKKSWRIGETIRIPYTLGQEISSRTNAALTVTSSSGGAGNWGVTFPAINPGPAMKLYFGPTAYNEYTSADISLSVDNEGFFSFGITNCTSVAMSKVVVSGSGSSYSGDTPLDVYIYGNTVNIPAKGCTWIHGNQLRGYTTSGGARFIIIASTADGNKNFGSFTVPSR